MSWSKSSKSLLLFLLFSSSLLCAESVLILQGNTAWYAPSSSSVAMKVDRVIRISGGGPVDPPIDPNPPNGSPLVAISATWRVKVDPYQERDQHRQLLQVTYRSLGEQVEAGSFTNMAQLQAVTEAAVSTVLGSSKPKWDLWGKGVGDYLLANVKSLDAAGAAYLDVAKGLTLDGEAIGPFLTAIITMLIKELIGGDLDPKFLELILSLLGSFFGGSV